MSVCITTYKSGSTRIRLIDTDNNKIACEISVYVKYFNSPEIVNWGIPLKGNPDYPGVIIKAVDLRIPPEIEIELREKDKPFIGATYTFNQETKKFTMKTDSGIFREGTYEWNITFLTLMFYSSDLKFHRPPFRKQFAMGLSLRAELVMPVFSINVGVGRNLIYSGGDMKGFYQILALKTYVTRHLFLHVGYQLSKFKDPNNLMLGLGYRFHDKR